MKPHLSIHAASLFAFVAPAALHAQSNYATPYAFVTLAGSDLDGSADGRGQAARFNAPSSVAVDNAGNVFVADTANRTIRRIAADGTVTTLAGMPGVSGSADGKGSSARFWFPLGVAVDGAGNVYVSDAHNHTIRKVTGEGAVTTLAGSPGSGGAVDGSGSAARFSGPSGIAVDGAGNVYVMEAPATIRKITSGGIVTTLAGNAGNFGSADGRGSAARFYGWLGGLAADSAGNVYVADTYNNTIRKVTSAGVVTTLAGSAGLHGSADGTGSAARFWNPLGVAVDAAGNVFVADSENHAIRKITAGGTVTTLAGVPGANSSRNGTGSDARFVYPSGVAVDSAGNVYVADGGYFDFFEDSVVSYGSNFIRKGRFSLAPTFKVQPISNTVAAGSNVALAVASSGAPAPAYQWFRNGEPMNGATRPTLMLGAVGSRDAGIYSVVATNEFGSTDSDPAMLAIAGPDTVPGYLRAISVRGNVGSGADAVFLGFALEGSGGGVLVKAIGPGIAAAPFSVPGTLADPRLDLVIAGASRSNDNWNGAPEIRSADNASGSFPLADAASRDAAMLLHLDSGVYSGTVSGVGNTTGVALVEFYGLDAPSNLKALSLRGRIGAGPDAFFAGFIIDGQTSRTVLIKAVGPGLAAAPFNVPNALADPAIELLQAQDGRTVSIGGNDNWGGASDLVAANLAAGAFPLNDPNSLDAAMLITLPPGIYIVKASGVNDTAGIGLVEIYGQ